MRALLIVLALLLAGGCASSQELFNSEQAAQIAEDASAEVAAQISELVEEWLGMELPDVVEEQIAGAITAIINPMIEDLLEKSEARKEED